MKFFIVFATVLAVSSMAKADGLAGLLGPLLHALQPTCSGLNNGLQDGSVLLGQGACQIGSALQSTTNGIGSLAGRTLPGLGETLSCAPGALYRTTKHLQEGNGLVRHVLDSAVGRVHGHARRSSSSSSS